MPTELFQISRQQRDRLQQELSTLLKQRVSLQQALREQQEQTAAASEALFLELLEVVDALECLRNAFAEHPEPNPQLWRRLPKSLGSIEQKLLGILAQRQVTPLDFQATQPDFNCCRVVDREIRTDLEPQTITQIVRQGFTCGDKLLRPVEVITSTETRHQMGN